jgi:electron transport complex protein RnfB
MLELIAAHPFWAALLALVSLALVFGAVLGFASVRFATEGNPIAEQINAILPQTQCGHVAIPAAAPTPKPLPGVRRLTNAHPAARP